MADSLVVDPAAIFFAVTVGIRDGWWVAALAAAAGVGVAVYAEWRARRRQAKGRS